MGPFQFRQPGLGQHPVDRPMVNAQRAGNGPHRPLLHMEAAQDLRFEFCGDAHAHHLLVRATPRCSRAPRPRAGWPWYHWPIAALAQEPQTDKGRAHAPAEIAAPTLRGRRGSRLVRGRCRGTRLGGQ